MGNDPEKSVVDSSLRFHGIYILRPKKPEIQGPPELPSGLNGRTGTRPLAANKRRGSLTVVRDAQ